MSSSRESNARSVYHIRVRGRLDPEWSDWFNGLAIIPQSGDETLLRGSVPDQPALHGLMAKISDLGLTLLSVTRVEGEE
jgi:hypothetical protein